MDQVVAQSLTLFKRLAARHQQGLAAETSGMANTSELVGAK